MVRSAHRGVLGAVVVLYFTPLGKISRVAEAGKPRSEPRGWVVGVQLGTTILLAAERRDVAD